MHRKPRKTGFPAFPVSHVNTAAAGAGIHAPAQSAEKENYFDALKSLQNKPIAKGQYVPEFQQLLGLISKLNEKNDIDELYNSFFYHFLRLS